MALRLRNYDRGKDSGLHSCLHPVFAVAKKEAIFQLRFYAVLDCVEFVRIQSELQKCPVNESQRRTSETTLAELTHEKVMIIFSSKELFLTITALKCHTILMQAIFAK